MQTPLEKTLLYAGMACMALSLFRQSLGLPPWTEMAFSGVGIMCFLGFFAARRRRTRSADSPPPRPSQSLALRLFSLFLIIVTAVSAPWWLPYTGVTLAFPQRVIVAVITLVVGVATYFIGWRYAAK